MDGGAFRTIGRYALYGAIASGGMATVHFGRLLGAGGFSRTVAVKRLHEHFARDPQFVMMFMDEARLASRIRHPNVVPTLDVVSAGDELFLVMEYVEGESLARLLKAATRRGERIPLPIACSIAAGLLHGLHAAHEARDERGAPLGIVHRDVSPQNVLVGSDGVARILDFGVAKAAGSQQTTREGQLKGKLTYMAPELFGGARPQRAIDVYAAAVVLWEAIVGRHLFAGETDADTVGRILANRVEPASKHVAAVPPELDAVIQRGLHADPSARFATASEMAEALAAAAPIAPSPVVGAWVRGLVEDALAERAVIIAGIESNGGISLPVQAAVPSDEQTTTVSETSLSHTSDPRRPRPRSRVRVPLVVAIGVVAGLAAGATLTWLVPRTGARSAATVSSAPPPVASASAPLAPPATAALPPAETDVPSADSSPPAASTMAPSSARAAPSTAPVARPVHKGPVHFDRPD